MNPSDWKQQIVALKQEQARMALRIEQLENRLREEQALSESLREKNQKLEQALASRSAAPAPKPVRRCAKMRVFVAASGHWGPRAVRVDGPAASLMRQGLVESITLVEPTGKMGGGTVSDGIDALWIQRDPPPWVAGLVKEGIPYLADLDDLLSHVPPHSTSFSEQENRARKNRLHPLIANAALFTVPNSRLLARIRSKFELPVPRAALIPNGFHYPPRPVTVGKPRGLLWSSSDFSSLAASAEAIFTAIDTFSRRHDLPVYCVGVFRKEVAALLRHATFLPAMTYERYGAFLAESGTFLGVAPLETQAGPEVLDFIACKSDVKMVDYGGFGHPAVYSAAPPYLDSDLRTGRVVENTFEAWTGALEDLFQEGYKTEEANAQVIRDKRSIDRVAREHWLPALERVRLENPLPFPVFGK